MFLSRAVFKNAADRKICTQYEVGLLRTLLWHPPTRLLTGRTAVAANQAIHYSRITHAVVTSL